MQLSVLEHYFIATRTTFESDNAANMQKSWQFAVALMRGNAER